MNLELKLEIHDVLIWCKSVRESSVRREEMIEVSVWDVSDRFEVEEANECEGASGQAAPGAQR